MQQVGKELHVSMKKKILFYVSCFLVRKEVRPFRHYWNKDITAMCWEQYLLISQGTSFVVQNPWRPKNFFQVYQILRKSDTFLFYLGTLMKSLHPQHQWQLKKKQKNVVSKKKNNTHATWNCLPKEELGWTYDCKDLCSLSWFSAIPQAQSNGIKQS